MSGVASRGCLAIASAFCLLCGCATSGPDPFEGANRKIFGFNEGLDRYLIAPVATGWDFVFPEFAQTGIDNAIDNLALPRQIGNHMLLFDARGVAQDTTRLIINTTVGLGGFLDVASRLDLPKNDADFGLTLGKYGAPPGPYIMIPLFGPTNVRDGIGLIADSVSNPYSYFMPFWGSLVIYTVRIANTRAIFLEEVAENRETSFDYYVFIRNAYLSNRRFLVDGREVNLEKDEDLYYFEEDLEGEVQQ